MELSEYQRLAARTINRELNRVSTQLHALHGISAEVGELHGIYQKGYQGHDVDDEHLKKECGDILWMLAEYCTANGWDLNEIAEMNIDKLYKRYPNGFNSEESLNRREGDI